MTPRHSTPESTLSVGGSVWSGQRPLCQVCGERPGQGIVAGTLVCGQCYEDAKSDTIRLWRASLKLIEGGWPR